MPDENAIIEYIEILQSKVKNGSNSYASLGDVDISYMSRILKGLKLKQIEKP